MCARRFLILIAVLTLIFISGAFALYQFGDRILIHMATPGGRYTPPLPGSRLDYSKLDAWIARPDMVDDPSRWIPFGAGIASADQGAAAIFYIHPTTYLERDRWNAPAQGNRDSDVRARLFVQIQASTFNHAGQIWAPRYRQAAYGAFLLNSEDAQKALALAYSDIEAGFAQFLRSIPRDTPVILAGHSQGALHISRLLERHGDQLTGRLIAAYVVGWPLSVTADLPGMGLPPCVEPSQFGCVLSWQSFKEPANPHLVTQAWVGTKGLTGAERRRADMLCVNPLTGTMDGEAPPIANMGTLAPDRNFSKATLVPDHVGARCDNGFLLIDGDVPDLGPYVLPGNNYHVYDYALFWANIGKDAARRLAAWMAQ